MGAAVRDLANEHMPAVTPAAHHTATKKSTAYSAARSQTRKTKLAQARAVATAREMASTVVPRYRIDPGTGEIIPDLRAAAAIIYDPETNQVLWEEHSQDQRSIFSL